MGRSFLVTMYIGKKSLEETIIIVFREVSGQPYLVLVIFLYRQNFWRIKFTPKFTQ